MQRKASLALYFMPWDHRITNATVNLKELRVYSRTYNKYIHNYEFWCLLVAVREHFSSQVKEFSRFHMYRFNSIHYLVVRI